jgi:acetate kinase
VRRGAAEGLAFLGVGVEDAETGGGDREISAPDVEVRTFVVEAREDIQIAGEVRRLLA